MNCGDRTGDARQAELLKIVRDTVPPVRQLHLYPPGGSAGPGHAVRNVRAGGGDGPLPCCCWDDLLDSQRIAGKCSRWWMFNLAISRCSVLGVMNVAEQTKPIRHRQHRAR